MFKFLCTDVKTGIPVYPAGAWYTKSIASLELRHKEHNNDPYSLHNNTIDFTQQNETIVHILTWYIEHHLFTRNTVYRKLVFSFRENELSGL